MSSKRVEANPPFNRTRFKKGEVDVWRISLDRGPAQVEELVTSLSPDEQRRAASFRDAVERDRFVIGRGSLRRILGRYLSVSAERVRFSYNRYGKPSVDRDFNPLRFNFTHSRGNAYAAIVYGREVGIDLEFVDRTFMFMGAARRAFSPEEYSLLQAMDPSLRVDAFFSGWTHKEALLKAMGTGFSNGAGERATDRNWTVTNVNLTQGYKGAIALEGGIGNINFRAEDSLI